jgi:EmrB/QacA subfamily drug resistance transporter
LDNTVLNVALPTLVRDLRATSSQLQWVLDAYALVFGGLLLVSGSLADRVGRKRVLLAGMAAFAAGSACAAFSGSVGALIAARAGMGVGAALMMPPTLSIITTVFEDPGERQRAIGFWAGSSGVGFALGPIIGGFLLAHFWWGSIFLINVPIAVAGIVCAVPLVPDSKNPAAAPPDLAGGVLSVGGLCLLLWAIIAAPMHGWSSGLVMATGAAGLAVLAGFAAWEHHSRHPMLNLAFFRSRSFSGAVSSVGLLMFALVGALFVLTQFLQFNLAYTPLEAGVRMLPIAAALVVVAPLSSQLVRIVGAKLVTAGGLALVAAGLWQVAGASVQWTYTDLLPGLIMTGIGAALVMPTVSGAVMGSVPRGDTAVAAATNGTFIQVGGALGVAVIGSVMSTRYQDQMSAALTHVTLPSPVRHAILGSIGGALTVAGQAGGHLAQHLEITARSAFVDATSVGLTVGAAVTVAGCIIALIAMPTRLPDHGPGSDQIRSVERSKRSKPLVPTRQPEAQGSGRPRTRS